MRNRRLWILLPAFLLVALSADLVLAEDDVTARLVEGFVYDDGVAMVRVEIGRVSEDIVKAVLVVPDGFRTEGPIGGSRRTTTINGVTRSVAEIGFRVTPPAGASGEYEIGPLELTKRSGAVVKIPVGRLKVGRRPEQGVRFTVTLEPPGGPVMMPFIARYRVLYSGEVDEDEDAFGSARHPLGLTSLTLPFLTGSDVKVKPGPGPDGDPAGNIRLGDQVLRVYAGHLDAGGTIYRTLEFSLEVTPLVTGSIDLAGTVGMSLVTGTRRQKDFFGRVVEVPMAEERRAGTGVATYEVKDLPTAGRPPGFTGAVGRYTIEADPQPREVNAFDPIEVAITVRGEGVLERISLPRWADLPEIARDFEVDSDLDPGEVVDGARVFKVVFRARSSAVVQFPSLPFPFYDPWSRSYRVARTAAVPIAVRNVKTVRPEDAVGTTAPVNPADAPPRTVIGRRLGVGANFTSLDAGSTGPAGSLFTGWFLVVLIAPPLFTVALFIVNRMRARASDVPRGTPLSRAITALGTDASTLSPDRAEEIFAAYFREQAELPTGELTPAELMRMLQARSVSPEVVSRVAATHRALISARFAGGESPTDLAAVLREVDACLG